MRDLGPPGLAKPCNVVVQVAARATVAEPQRNTLPGVHFNPALVAGLGVAAATATTGVYLANSVRADVSRHEKEIQRAFGGGDAKFPIIKRYATKVSERYATAVAMKLEAVLFTEVIKVASIGAFTSLYDNVKQADALGHPVILTNSFNRNHVPIDPEVNAEDVEKFVLDVLDEEDEHVGFIPRQMETELIRNAFVAGIYVMEDTVQSFSARLFGSKYELEIFPSDKGWVRPELGANVHLSDAVLTKLVREELKAPFLTRLVPSLERNVARVAVALAGEVVGTAEFVFLGLPLKFRLRAKEEAVSETVQSLAAKEAREAGETTHGTDGTSNSSTDQIIEAYVEAYMTSRKENNRGFGLRDNLFFSKKLERDTYVGFLKQIFGTIDGSTIAEVLGFDIVVSVGTLSKNCLTNTVNALDLKTFRDRLSKSSSKESRLEIEVFVDWLMADPVYNIKAVPDSVERQVYINVFELLASLVSVALTTFEVQLLGRAIKMKVTPSSQAELKTDLSLEKPFKPDPAVIAKFAKSVTPVKPAQEVMCNVFAFALAFVAFEIKSVRAVMVGRELSVALARPLESHGFEDLDLEQSLDVEFNAALRKALVVLAQEMMLASPGMKGKDMLKGAVDAKGDGGVASGVKTKGNTSTETENQSSRIFGGFLSSARGVLTSFGAFGSMDDDDKIFGKATVSGDSRTLKSFEDTVYATFVAHHSEPDNKFPFAYLTPNAFDDAVTELVAILRPGENVPRSATAAVAAAADANGDGVIQWQEYYFCAKELSEVLSGTGEL